jgi:plastocyanin
VAPISVTTGSPPFVAALPDAGSNHIVMVWSDADGGGFDYWVPIGYQGETLGLAIRNNGTATSITVQVGDTVDFELYSNLPALGECDSSSNVAPNMTCVNLWQLASTGGQSQIVATDQSTLIGYYSTITEASSDSTGAVWTTQVTYDQPGTYTLHGVLQNSAPNWPGGIDPRPRARCRPTA